MRGNILRTKSGMSQYSCQPHSHPLCEKNNMTNNKWTDEKLVEEAGKYETKQEFRTKSNSAYAKNKGQALFRRTRRIKDRHSSIPASSRLIVTEGIHDAFVDAMVQRMQLLTVGDARASNTDIGPVVSEEQLTNNLDYLRIGAAEGAKHITGGDRVERATPGWYLSPALFVEAQREMRICREEIFGPIASVISVTDYDEALAVANDADYGLSAGIVSNDRSKIDHFVANIQAGMAQVNLPTAGMDFHAPFTGRKGSSFGPPEKGSHCREFFTNSKVVHARYGEPYSTGKAGS
jgi:hypothetical protein